jgi:excisionase family DNA binding protein
VLERESGNRLGNRSTRKRLKSISKKPSTRSKQEILTPDQVAEFLRVSRRTITHLVATEAIPFVRIGKRVVRFKRHAVTKWLQEHNTKKAGR